MSPLLRRLGVTRRRSRVDLEHDLRVAETDRDIARAEKASAYEALGKVAAAAGRPGAPTRWNVEDLVEWATAARKAAADRLVDVLGLTPCVRDGCGHARHQHAGECRGVLAGTRGAPCRCEAFDDGVVDAKIEDARSLETGGGLVCGACGTPYPCPEHQPDALAAARDDGAAMPAVCLRQVGEGWCVRERGHDGDHADVGRYGARVFRAYDVWDRVIPGDPTPRMTGDPACAARVYGTGLGGGPVSLACCRTRGHDGQHVAAGRDWVHATAKPDDPWCSTDLDGSPCVRPAGHTEPCRPIDPAPVGLQVAKCHATTHDESEYRCSFVAGHPGLHSWSPELADAPF